MAEMDGDPFVVARTEDLENPQFMAGEAEYQRQERQQPPPPGYEGGEVKDDVVGLIPLCVRHTEGPQINTAVFGYDIAQMQKRPWDEPGANLKDYFNYGFNESSWRLYCAMQAEGESSLLAKANTFLMQLNSTAMKGAADDAAGGGDGGMYYMPPQHPQGSSHGYYGGSREGYHGTKVCQRFMEGCCNKGDHCNYSHVFGGVYLSPGMRHQHHHYHSHQRNPQCVLPTYASDPGVLPQVVTTGVLDTKTPAPPYNTAVRSHRPVEE
uniref:Uncharacterized protein TCIL3000_5_4940 n=1 Tax=Trypanosoma congolense (strain IL3000) TaxID=1068625 RepID=G0UM70_TRYCI|nr:unnamed protein product [Trypanosoma congolense IL3000]